jgi:RNA polymerase sigma factor (sigma-70 family)
MTSTWDGVQELQEFNDFADLYIKERPKLLRFLASKGVTPEDAEDIIQTACQGVLRSWGSKMLESPASWFRKAVENAFNHHYRRRSAKKRSTHLVPVDQEPVTPAPNPEQASLSAELLGQLNRCLRALKPLLQQSLMFKSIDNPLEDIAKAMSTQEGTVKSRIHTARNQVRDCLRRNLQPDSWMTVMDVWEDFTKEAFAQDQKGGRSSHLDERQLIALANGDLTLEQRQPLLEHLIVCPSCARYLKRIQAALRERETFGPMPAPRAWYGPWLGLAAGLILGFSAFYALQRPPEPLQNPLRLELRADAAIRSTDPIILEARDALDLQLGLLPGVAHQAYRLDLVQDGTVRRSFEQVRLQAGTLSLILPAVQVPEGRFELRAMGLDGAAETTLATFTLDVRKAP